MKSEEYGVWQFETIIHFGEQFDRPLLQHEEFVGFPTFLEKPFVLLDKNFPGDPGQTLHLECSNSPAKVAGK